MNWNLMAGGVEGPIIEAEITVKIHCLCGCGKTMEIDLPLETIGMGDVGVWENPLFELAIGMIPPGMNPRFYDVLCNVSQE